MKNKKIQSVEYRSYPRSLDPDCKSVCFSFVTTITLSSKYHPVTSIAVINTPAKPTERQLRQWLKKAKSGALKTRPKNKNLPAEKLFEVLCHKNPTTNQKKAAH